MIIIIIKIIVKGAYDGAILQIDSMERKICRNERIYSAAKRAGAVGAKA